MTKVSIVSRIDNKVRYEMFEKSERAYSTQAWLLIDICIILMY